MLSVHYALPPDFPVDDLWAVARQLTDADICVPGYLPPGNGLMAPDSFLYAHQVEKQKTVLLPDRNVVSRWVQTVNGHAPLDGQHRTAAGLLAFCQCLDIFIEPSIAFHELSASQTLEVAEDELSWFKAADNHPAPDWLDFALARTDGVVLPGNHPGIKAPKLVTPLHRWRCNYVLALKIAELESVDMAPKMRVRTFFEWMQRDFILGGPSALLALLYFAPNSAPRKRLFKGSRSPDRERAIAGVQNAAWDLTHISEFVRQVRDTPFEKTQFLLASFDDGLRRIAGLAFGRREDETEEERLTEQLGSWWPAKDIHDLATLLNECFRHAGAPAKLAAQSKMAGHIDRLIAAGEAVVRRPIA